MQRVIEGYKPGKTIKKNAVIFKGLEEDDPRRLKLQKLHEGSKHYLRDEALALVTEDEALTPVSGTQPPTLTAPKSESTPIESKLSPVIEHSSPQQSCPDKNRAEWNKNPKFESTARLSLGMNDSFEQPHKNDGLDTHATLRANSLAIQDDAKEGRIPSEQKKIEKTNFLSAAISFSYRIDNNEGKEPGSPKQSTQHIEGAWNSGYQQFGQDNANFKEDMRNLKAEVEPEQKFSAQCHAHSETAFTADKDLENKFGRSVDHFLAANPNCVLVGVVLRLDSHPNTMCKHGCRGAIKHAVQILREVVEKKINEGKHACMLSKEFTSSALVSSAVVFGNTKDYKDNMSDLAKTRSLSYSEADLHRVTRSSTLFEAAPVKDSEFKKFQANK